MKLNFPPFLILLKIYDKIHIEKYKRIKKMKEIIFPLDKKELIVNCEYELQIQFIKKESNNIIIAVERNENSQDKYQHYKIVLFYDNIPGYVNFEAIEVYIKAQPEKLMCIAWVNSDNIEYTWVVHGLYKGVD